uniref:Zinc finger protein LEE1 n=1 Tax=Strongyloides papillosus TaxID=174720 RepID=A0A0N5B6M5_STREA
MFHGTSNTMEGNYIGSPSPGFPISTPSLQAPIGYVPQLPGTMSPYPTGPALVSPVYYVSSLSSPLQQISSVVYMGNNCSSTANNSLKNTIESPSTSTYYDSKNPENTTSSKNDINNSSNTSPEPVDKETEVSPCSKNSPIDETSSTLLVTDRFAVKLEPNKFIHGVPATKWYTLSDEERNTVIRNQRRIISYKTALCTSYRAKGTCSFGENCRFAHSLDELKPPPVRHPKYKTQLCDKFSATGICPYGSRCNFIHATKSGQIVSDYPKYLACLQKEALNNDIYDDYDDDKKAPFALSMSAIPRKYSLNERIELTSGKLSADEKPQQVINFSKSFGTPMVKTIFRNGKLLKNNIKEKNDNEMDNDSKCALHGYDKGSTTSSLSRTSSRTSSSSKMSEKKERSVLEKLFTESYKFKSFKKEVMERTSYIDEDDSSDSNEIDENSPPGSQSYTNGYWKGNSSRRYNYGFYSQSEVPKFLRFDNV